MTEPALPSQTVVARTPKQHMRPGRPRGKGYDVRARNVELKNEKLSLEIGKLRGDMVSRDDYIATLQARETRWRSSLLAQITTLPAILCGMTADEIREELEQSFNRVMEECRK